MKNIKSCEFNIDTGCVELRFADGSMIAIDCTAVENEIADNRFQRSELDYLMFGESLFTLARDEANVTLKKGVKGDSTYIMNANKAGKLTITLQQESPDIEYIESCAESNVMANLAITDANDNGSVFFAQNVMVEKLPDRARGKDAADVSVVFLIPDIKL